MFIKIRKAGIEPTATEPKSVMLPLHHINLMRIGFEPILVDHEPTELPNYSTSFSFKKK